MKKSLPGILYERFIKLLFIGITIIICSIALSFSKIFPSPIAVLKAGLFVGAVFILMALYFNWTINKNGYDVYRGKNVGTQYSSLSGFKPTKFKKPTSYLIECNNVIIEIPAFKMRYVIPEGADVNVYTPKNILMYEQNGVKKPTVVWGVEMVKTIN